MKHLYAVQPEPKKSNQQLARELVQRKRKGKGLPIVNQQDSGSPLLLIDDVLDRERQVQLAHLGKK
jgi:hypothetical protein